MLDRPRGLRHGAAPFHSAAGLVLRDFSRTFAQLTDPTFRKVLVLSLISAVLVSALVLVAAGWLLTDLHLFSWGWVNDIIAAAGVIGTAYVGWLLFPGVAIAIESLFLERIVAAVERRHYPDAPPPRDQGVGEQVWAALRLGLVVLAANLILLPVYLLLLFVPPLNLFVYWLVNGVLIGREYFELVAMRRVPPAEANALRKRYRYVVLATGVASALLFSIPIVNLLAPLVATGAMVHLFARLHRPAIAGAR